jgi:hypothetical protein
MCEMAGRARKGVSCAVRRTAETPAQRCTVLQEPQALGCMRAHDRPALIPLQQAARAQASWCTARPCSRWRRCCR